ncbi:MAG: CoA transferase [Chloroflexi bacterium]|nr:CoA transferase [Chloroflexota bacterium]MCY3588097.1 CoA transferase [Chloroflexota bacterium]MCY3686076.1 CoA transferase [Chloroflexota bacterium]MDE2710069.1 CoA transferase [Chloroflexota bacterium]
MLSPYRVIDLTDERGVLAGQMLADLGADVIQVEPPTGSTGRGVAPFFADRPDESIYWAAYTRGKRGITCNLEDSRGRELLLQLLESADFLLESSDVGRMAELGLDYETLHDRFPRLIYTSISAFGQTGPKSHYVGSDLAIWAAGTPLLMSGDDDRAPVRISQPQAWGHASGDAGGGSMLALHARHQTGHGQHVDISAQVSAAQATLAQVLAHQLGAADPERYGGGVKIRGQAIRGTADVADGYIVLLMGPGPAVGHFANHAVKWLVEIGAAEPELLNENFVTYADRVATGQADPALFPRIQDIMREAVASRTKQEMLDISIEYDLLLAPVLDIVDLGDSPQLDHRGFWQELEHADSRRVTYPGPPLNILVDGQHQGICRRPPPELGQHNAEVYGALGISADELGRLRSEGVI